MADWETVKNQIIAITIILIENSSTQSVITEYRIDRDYNLDNNVKILNFKNKFGQEIDIQDTSHKTIKNQLEFTDKYRIFTSCKYS